MSKKKVAKPATNPSLYARVKAEGKRKFGVILLLMQMGGCKSTRNVVENIRL